MSASQTEPKTYSSPKVNKLTPEQAKIYPIGQAITAIRERKPFWMYFFDPPPQNRNLLFGSVVLALFPHTFAPLS